MTGGVTCVGCPMEWELIHKNLVNHPKQRREVHKNLVNPRARKSRSRKLAAKNPVYNFRKVKRPRRPRRGGRCGPEAGADDPGKIEGGTGNQ